MLLFCVSTRFLTICVDCFSGVWTHTVGLRYKTGVIMEAFNDAQLGNKKKRPLFILYDGAMSCKYNRRKSLMTVLLFRD